MHISKFVLFQSTKNHEYYFHLKAGNGEIILDSEGYTTKASCLNGIASVKENSQNIDRFKLLIAKNEEHYFNLVAGNGEIIGSSETYKSKQGRDNGIQSVKRNAPDAEIIDSTIENNQPEPENEITIIINGRPKVVQEKKLSFIEIIKLAFGSYLENDRTVYTMTYKKAVDKHQGSLVLGEELKIKTGVIINVTSTDKS